MSLRPSDVLTGINAVAARLSAANEREEFTLVVAGAMSALLSGELPADRLTNDCDVIWTEDEAKWKRLEQHIRVVGTELGLPSGWLNSDCRVFAYLLPLGWRKRCVPVIEFGPLKVVRLARLDLLAAKLLANRPQDRRDLLALGPGAAELEALDAHVDRLEQEDLNARSYDKERALIAALREAAHGG